MKRNNKRIRNLLEIKLKKKYLVSKNYNQKLFYHFLLK